MNVTLIWNVTPCSLAYRNLFCSEDGGRISPETLSVHHPALRHIWSGGVRTTLHVAETCVGRFAWFLTCAAPAGDVAGVSDGHAASIVRVEVRRIMTTVLSVLSNTVV